MNTQLLITSLLVVIIIIISIVTFSKINSLNNKLNSVSDHFDDGNIVGIKSIRTVTGWTIQDNGLNELQIALTSSKNDQTCGIAPATDDPVLWFFKNDGTLYGPSCGDSTTPQIGSLPLLRERKCERGQNC